MSQDRNTEPRPIVLQILFAYGFSAMMDVPNFFKYEIKDCSNKTSEDAPLDKDCWSFVEVSGITEGGWWPTWIAIRSIVIRIIPLLAIIVMNIMIIWKLRQIWKKKKSLFCPGTAAELPSRSRMETTVGSTVPAISSPALPEVGVLPFSFAHKNQAGSSEASVGGGCGQVSSCQLHFWWLSIGHPSIGHPCGGYEETILDQVAGQFLSIPIAKGGSPSSPCPSRSGSRFFSSLDQPPSLSCSSC